jgi:SAM-dependent methyltransferase
MTSDSTASMVFSDFTQINEDGTANFTRFNEANGWVYTSENINGIPHLRCHAMQATPHNVGYIWYAPNHVRAFRRTSYDKVGGYDETLGVLDDQELMNRLYEVGSFRHIDKCLYLQRMHGKNTQLDPETNAFIQQQTVDYYLEYIEALTLAWAGREGLAAISLTTATSIGAVEEDERLQRVSLDPARPKLGYGDNSVGVIKAVDILQRVPDRAAFLNECYRVLRHGGLLLTDTPSTDGRGAFQDPSHVAFYNENSFMYFTQAGLRPSIPTLSSRWQVSNLQTYWPSETHERINIPYVKGNLIAIKDGPRQGGPLLV